LDLSVVLATYNRAHLLPLGLTALAAQQLPADFRWELVVVDNNSADSTRDVVEAFARNAPMPATYLFEPEQGTSAARNAGIRQAKGDLIAFTDDDVELAPDWLAMVTRAVAQCPADVVGGRILPRWPSPPPRWLRDQPELRTWLALMEHDRPLPLRTATDEEAKIWTANMVVRRAVLTELDGFNTRLGPVADRLYRDEDAELLTRMLRAGYTAVYDPRLVVHHHITPERMRRSYFRRYSVQVAEGRALQAPRPARRALYGTPLYGYRYAATQLVRWLAALVCFHRDAFMEELEFLAAVGRLRGHWKRDSTNRNGHRS